MANQDPSTHLSRIFPKPNPVKRSSWLAKALAAWAAAALATSAFGHQGPVLWVADLDGFDDQAYLRAVDLLLEAAEEERGSPLAPGERGRVGLKIHTGAGPGLATPRPLVRAVARALRERGFERENIFLIDLNEGRMRRSGFLPPLAEGRMDFEGHPVYVLERGNHFDPLWYYESPLPPRHEPGFPLERRPLDFEDRGEDRKSHLAAPLILEVDFWINLPMFSDHRELGLAGALVNATLWNAGNTLRFLNSSASGPVAVAEMAAIPEFWERWALTIATMERVQFVGGPVFHSLHTFSEPLLLATRDPVLLDSRVLQKINQARKERRFALIPEDLPMFDYASQVGLGSPFFVQERKIRLDSPKPGKQVK